MSLFADMLGIGGATPRTGIPAELLASMLGGGSGRRECFPTEAIAKCSEAGEQFIRDLTLRHALENEHMVKLSKNLPKEIQNMRTKYTRDREFIADKDELPKWQLVKDKDGHMDHIKTADYIQKIESRVAINAACIETLEEVEALFTNANAKAMEAARSLVTLNNDPSEDAMVEFKEGALKTYEDSKLALNKRISEIAGTIPQQQMYQLFPGIEIGLIFLNSAQKGTDKALKVTDSNLKSLEKYERILRSCLAGVAATFEEVELDRRPGDEKFKLGDESDDEGESSSEDDDLYT